MTATTLGPIGLDFLEARGISGETAGRFEIYTAARVSGAEVLPDHDGNVIAFPFIEHGVVVNEKYRTPDKKFWQRPGGRRTFWNSDVLDDPKLSDGREALIITEGEIDALSAIECRFPFTVSVPDGAPAVKPYEVAELIESKVDLGAEQTGKFEFLYNNRDRLKHIKRFTIAVDNDAAGKKLAAELVRRLSAVRCQFVVYPEDCKDLNDVLMKHGRDAVHDVLQGAKPYPVHGLYRLSEYPDLPPLQTFSTGWDTLDAHIRLFPGEFMVVTGIPGHGKSTWVLNLVRHLADLHRWRTAMFSPEMPTIPQLRDKLRTMKLGRGIRPLFDREALEAIDAWIDDMIVFIDTDPTGRVEEVLTLEWILDRATDAVLRDGIRVLVIDPWNEIEHAKDPRESMGDYIGRSIRTLKRWGTQHGVAVIVIAHPTKEVGKDGKPRAPTPYDIDGSAHWFNKPDHIVVVWSDDSETSINVRKVRFDGTGTKGKVKMRFEIASSRYLYLDAPGRGF